MQESSLQSVGSVQVFSGHVTEDIIYQEFVKMGMQDFVANDLSKRYYRNELTYKDIEYLENNFNFRFEKLEEKISGVEKRLEDRINSVESNLNLKIEMTERSLRSEITSVKTELKSDIKDLDNKIDKIVTEFKGRFNLHNWMFGTIITLNVGILLTLISIVYSLLNK
ncbi:Bdr family repetitive protein [Borrelia coriaceae]|uniref:BDR-repeat family protein n=1 Tax=Borrelia coriaceae ATCC 43381 TaxID=1408429 RepID=W5T2X9_9SPIR|nr:Bdr family repetitive protein [Borrelia coriaceae]AHH11676.1 BDR-repeat family protein [Borrelia coriaceae ATCC 43381]